MKIKITVLTLVLIATFGVMAQQSNNQKMANNDNPPYHQIPEAPDNYNNVNVVARMIDGLGYRYYWATKDLREEDLAYQISPDSRDAAHTLDHLYGLSETIVNATTNTPNLRPSKENNWTFEEKRAKTLENFKAASDELRASKRKDLKKMKVIFQRGEKKSEFPFWNMLNGPIADAIYHTGQIVSYRRASGNPINPKVNVFIGKNRE